MLQNPNFPGLRVAVGILSQYALELEIYLGPFHPPLPANVAKKPLPEEGLNESAIRRPSRKVISGFSIFVRFIETGSIKTLMQPARTKRLDHPGL